MAGSHGSTGGRGTNSDWAGLDRIPREIQELAYQFWLDSGRAPGREVEHWLAAEKQIWESQWPCWALARQKRFLSREAIDNASALHETLDSHLPLQQDMTGMLVVLDGSPERSQHWFRKMLGSDAAQRKAEEKDALFCRRFLEEVEPYQSKIEIADDAPSDSEDVSRRHFQDGYAIAFGGAHRFHPQGINSTCTTAVLAASHLRSCLSANNELECLSWEDRIHTRISLGRTWYDAVRCLTVCRRDQIAMPESMLTLFEANATKREILKANNYVCGLSSEASTDGDIDLNEETFHGVVN